MQIELLIPYAKRGNYSVTSTIKINRHSLTFISAALFNACKNTPPDRKRTRPSVIKLHWIYICKNSNHYELQHVLSLNRTDALSHCMCNVLIFAAVFMPFHYTVYVLRALVLFSLLSRSVKHIVNNCFEKHTIEKESHQQNNSNNNNNADAKYVSTHSLSVGRCHLNEIKANEHI